MKPTYILLISFVACLPCFFSSCSSDDSDEVEIRGAEMLFAAVDRSRSSVTTTIDRFAVYGDMKHDGDNTFAPSVVFNNIEVLHNSDGWSYQGTRYWIPKYEYSFVAIHPAAEFEGADNTIYDNSKLSFTYTLPTDDGGLVNTGRVTDIVTATHRRLYNENDVNNVTTFRFSHLLSLINFAIELSDGVMESTEYCKIHKIELSGFAASATINITPAQRQSNNQTDDSEIDIIAARADKGQLAIEFKEPIKIGNGDPAVKIFNEDEAIIMLPQTAGADDEVKISLTYSLNEQSATSKASATLSGFTWASGRSYNYKFKLGSGNALMLINNTEIKDWIAVDGHDIADAI